MSNPVTADGLSFTAGGALLVDTVSLTIEKGELVAVIGPNGAGKSTLLALLAGDVRPDEGTIHVAGHELADVDMRVLAGLRAILTQHRVSEIPFTAYEVVAMGRHPHRRDHTNSSAADSAAIATAMERTATTRFADRVFSTLSGGEQARVSIARVLAQEAPLLLLDEPTSALDVAHEERVMQELTTRAAAGSAIVAILHDLNAAARYASRIVLMSLGRVLAIGSPAAVLTDSLLSTVYEQPMRVVDHPFRDCPLILVAD